MPVFNIKNSLDVGATSIPFDDPAIVNFLGDIDSQYISAKEALENSDIYSAIFQKTSITDHNKLKKFLIIVVITS